MYSQSLLCPNQGEAPTEESHGWRGALLGSHVSFPSQPPQGMHEVIKPPSHQLKLQLAASAAAHHA